MTLFRFRKPPPAPAARPAPGLVNHSADNLTATFNIDAQSSVIIGPGVTGNIAVTALGGSVIRIAEGCIFKNAYIHADLGAEISIGRRSAFQSKCRIHAPEKSSIKIGEDVLFGTDVLDMHSVINLRTRRRTNFAKSISIAPRVWIAERVTILKGARDRSLERGRHRLGRACPPSGTAQMPGRRQPGARHQAQRNLDV